MHSAAAFLQLLHVGYCPSHYTVLISSVQCNQYSIKCTSLPESYGAGIVHTQGAGADCGEFRCRPYSVHVGEQQSVEAEKRTSGRGIAPLKRKIAADHFRHRVLRISPLYVAQT